MSKMIGIPGTDPQTIVTPGDLEEGCPNVFAPGDAFEGRHLITLQKATILIARALGREDFGPANRFVHLDLPVSGGGSGSGLVEFRLEMPHFQDLEILDLRPGCDVLVRYSAGYPQADPDSPPATLPVDPKTSVYWINPQIPVDLRSCAVALLCRMGAGSCDMNDNDKTRKAVEDVMMGANQKHSRLSYFAGDPARTLLLPSWPLNRTVYDNTSAPATGGGSEVPDVSGHALATVNAAPRVFCRDPQSGRYFRDETEYYPGTTVVDPDALVGGEANAYNERPLTAPIRTDDDHGVLIGLGNCWTCPSC